MPSDMKPDCLSSPPVASGSPDTSHIYRSDTREDIIFETADGNLAFTEPLASNGGGLPHDVPLKPDMRYESMMMTVYLQTIYWEVLM